MIRINLATVKKRKPIKIPFAAIFLILGLIGIGGGYMFLQMTFIKGANDKYIQEKEELKEEVEAAQGKLDEKDSLTQRLSEINAQIDRLKQLSGANLVQWSRVFTDLSSVVPPKTVWITNLRIDSDRRVQITGYSCLPEGGGKGGQLTKGIQSFIADLQGNSTFNDIFLTSATKNTYEKKPVWRFDINCRVKREVGEQG